MPKESLGTESGRRSNYICPECAVIGYGIYGCNSTRSGDTYLQSDFASENGYEDPELIEGPEPFEFSADNYKRLIGEAYVL